MRKNSLQYELDKLKSYIKEIDGNRRLTKAQLTIYAYTISGMIEHIYSLIATGAYTPFDDSLDDLFNIVEFVRNTAIHYNKSADFNVMISYARDIIKATPQSFSKSITERLRIAINSPYQNCLLVSNSAELKITDGDYIVQDTILFENIRTKEKLYIPKKNVYIVENKITGTTSYLVKFSPENSCFYKNNDDPTIQVSINQMYSKKYFVSGYPHGKEKVVDLEKSINKIISHIIAEPYKSHLVVHSHGRDTYSFSAYNIIDDCLKYHQIDENIALGKFSLKEQSIDTRTTSISSRLPHGFEKAILDNASLRDVLFIETFLKGVNAYREKLKEAEEEGVEITNYAKHSLLLELYKKGPHNFSEQLIKTYPEFAELFYEYRSVRNSLAHTPIDDEILREELISSLEEHNDRLFAILNDVYHVYSKDKRKYPYAYLKGGVKLDNSKLFNNKTELYNIYKHTGETIVINGVKYLRLMSKEKNNLYIQADGTVYIYNYNTESSYECVSPVNGTRIVEIDKNGIVSKSKENPYSPRSPIHFDAGGNALLEAYNYLQHFPQADSKELYKNHEIKSLPIITVYDAMGPSYNEPLKSVLSRRFNHKFLPRELFEGNKCVLYDDIDRPIEILNKDNQIVATIYYGNIKKNGTITQVCKDGQEREIPHGRSTLRNSDTSKIITPVTLERKRKWKKK